MFEPNTVLDTINAFDLERVRKKSINQSINQSINIREAFVLKPHYLANS